MPLRIAVLGATGSIGRQTLQVAKELGVDVAVVAASRPSPALFKAAEEASAEAVAVSVAADAPTAAPYAWFSGPQALAEAAAWPDVDTVVVAVTGLHGIAPSLTALRRGRRVAIANKETLVCAGHLLREAGGELVPVDSEHSALWQLLQGRSDVTKLWITASGGALRDLPLSSLEHVTAQEALAHPTWLMGPKVTIDSATLMNKGLEVMEAACLFDRSFEEIGVLLHPQSVVHALVQLRDGSLLAQCARPDMRLAIAYALTFPERAALSLTPLGLEDGLDLRFARVPAERYPALKLCYRVGKIGKTMPVVLNAANDVAVQAFLDGALPFPRIVPLVEEVLGQHTPMAPDLDTIYAVDAWARQKAQALLPS